MPTYGDETGTFGRTAQQGAFEGLGDALGGGNPFKNDYRNIGAGDYAYRGKGEDWFRKLGSQRGTYYQGVAGQGMQHGGEAWQNFQNSPDANAALAQLADAAAGKTPSMAEQMMGRGLQQNQMQQMSAAAGARGGPGAWAAAQRGAAANMANAGQDIIGQQGMARTQEMTDARGAYAQAAMQKRMQDLQASGMSYDQALAAMGQGDKAMMGFYGLGQNAAGQDMAGRQSYADWITAQATGKDAVNRQASGSALSAIGSVAAMASDARVKRPMTGAAWDDPHTRQLANPYAAPAPEESATDWGTLSKYIGALAGGVGAMSDARVKRPYDPGAYVSDEKAKQRAFQKGMAWMASAGGDEQNALGALSQIEDLQPIDRYGIAIRKAKLGDAEGARTYATEAMKGSPFSAKNPSGLKPEELEALKALAAGPVSTSAIEPTGARNASDQLLQKLGESQSVYQYKDPKFQAPGVQGQPAHLGVMAQDLEKTPMGDSLVQTDKEGVKRVNTLAAQGAALAALGRMHERVSDLEKRKHAR